MLSNKLVNDLMRVGKGKPAGDDGGVAGFDGGVATPRTQAGKRPKPGTDFSHCDFAASVVWNKMDRPKFVVCVFAVSIASLSRWRCLFSPVGAALSQYFRARQAVAVMHQTTNFVELCSSASRSPRGRARYPC